VFYTKVVDKGGERVEKLSDGKLAYGVDEAAQALGVSFTQVRGWIREGKLRALRVGRRVLIRREVLEEFLRDLEEGRVR
jgi:excisionase family DNA binding protein